MSAPAAEQTREALLTYLDALTVAEPIQARLWHTAEITLTQLSVLRELRDGPRTLGDLDRKSTRLNSSHVEISYAVFCLKKKKKTRSVCHCLIKKKNNTKQK